MTNNVTEVKHQVNNEPPRSKPWGIALRFIIKKQRNIIQILVSFKTVKKKEGSWE